MISWFSKSRIRNYVKLSERKQNKVKMGLNERYEVQLGLLESRLESARFHAKQAHRLDRRGKKEKLKEQINSFKLELASSQPILNKYVGTSLEKQLMEVMSMEGFEFPDALLDLRSDIDFGLFAVDTSDELGALLEKEANPFDELGIDI